MDVKKLMSEYRCDQIVKKPECQEGFLFLLPSPTPFFPLMRTGSQSKVYEQESNKTEVVSEKVNPAAIFITNQRRDSQRQVATGQ